jgi:fucose 4-O-acetylase-like acetyltransferase
VVVIFLLSVIIGCFNEFGGLMSVSRTVCFSGFFLLGYYTPENILAKIKQRKIPIIILGVIAIIFVCIFCNANIIPKKVLHDSVCDCVSYKLMGISRPIGMLIRTGTILISIILGSFFLVIIPKKRNILSIIGRNTILVLLFHKYFLMIFQKFVPMKGDTIIEMIVMLVVAIGITLFLSISVFHRIYGKIMAVIEKLFLRVEIEK